MNKSKIKRKSIKKGLYFFVIMLIFTNIYYLITEGNYGVSIIVSSIIGSALGGFLYALITFYQLKRFEKIIPDYFEDETKLIEAIATDINGFKGMTGKLFLTEKRLIFKTRSGIQKDILEVKSCKTGKTLGLFKNRLIIEHPDGKDVFSIEKPELWCNKISTRE